MNKIKCSLCPNLINSGICVESPLESGFETNFDSIHCVSCAKIMMNSSEIFDRDRFQYLEYFYVNPSDVKLVLHLEAL